MNKLMNVIKRLESKFGWNNNKIVAKMVGIVAQKMIVLKHSKNVTRLSRNFATIMPAIPANINVMNRLIKEG